MCRATCWYNATDASASLGPVKEMDEQDRARDQVGACTACVWFIAMAVVVVVVVNWFGYWHGHGYAQQQAIGKHKGSLC